MSTKKNKSKNYLKFGIFLFGVLLLLWNCEKEELVFYPENNNNIENITFDEAMEFFNENEPKSTFLARGQNSLTVTPNWESIASQELVYAEKSLVKADADINRSGNFYAQLLFIKINGQIINVICTTYKDEADANGNLVNGRIYFNKIDGTFIDAYRIEEGFFTKRLVPKKSVNQASFFPFFQKTDQQDCWNTDNLPDDGQFEGISLTVYKPHMLTAGAYSTNGSGSSGDNYYSYVNNGTGINTTEAHSGLNNLQIINAAGVIMTSPPVEEIQCPNGLKNDFGECVDDCRSGKRYNETTKNCECIDPNQIEDWQGNCVENPCNKITNLFNDYSNLKQELINLKGFTSASTERGRYKLTSSNFIQTPPTGSDGYVNIPIPTTGQYVMFAHTHNSPASGTLSVPSFADIEAMATLLKLGKIDASNFVFFLMTADGTNYAITIDNPIQFLKVFATQFDDGFDFDIGVNRYNMKIKYYTGIKDEPPLIKEDNSDNIVDEKLFLDFLETTKMGLSLFEVNNTFDEFTRVTHNKTTGNIDKNNCN